MKFFAAFQNQLKTTENFDSIKNLDPLGIGMTAIGMAVVFISLLLLYVLFLNVSSFVMKKTTKKMKSEGRSESEIASGVALDMEINAAIATAIHLYFKEQHDDEQAVLTIKKISRNYSPWSSKLYGLRRHPRH